MIRILIVIVILILIEAYDPEEGQLRDEALSWASDRADGNGIGDPCDTAGCGTGSCGAGTTTAIALIGPMLLVARRKRPPR